MTAAQLALLDVPATPKLTGRQNVALKAIQESGAAGLHTDELGATVHGWQGRHSSDDICQFCASVGQELGKALRAKGLAQQRRRKAPGGDTVTVWTVAGRIPTPPVVRDPDDFSDIGF